MVNVLTYEDIMERYLNRLPDNMDTREGSLAHIVMSATALSVAQLYEELKLVEENAYASTAFGEELDKCAIVIGIERRGKTKAIVKIEGDEGFVEGVCVTGGEMEYEIISVEDGYYLAECTTAGVIGNSYVGEVVPVGDSGELGNLSITAIVARAEDDEDDESLRKRYMERINCPVCAGNVSYYKEAIHSIAGVGGIKIEPVYEGAGTVKVIITDESHSVAGEELVKYVKELLDPSETSGQGYGIAPIGHKVTVETVEKVDVDIVVEINQRRDNDYYNRLLRSNLPRIFSELNKEWDQSTRLVLRDRVIEDYLLEISPGIDISVISINGQANRLILEKNQILGDVTINGV